MLSSGILLVPQMTLNPNSRGFHVYPGLLAGAKQNDASGSLPKLPNPCLQLGRNKRDRQGVVSLGSCTITGMEYLI